MSYVVHIWEWPLPESYVEAVAIRSRLAAATPNPRLSALATRLTARFPDIGGLDEDADPGVWTDGPLANNARSAVFAIGVQTHALDVVLPFVISEAGALGLLVLDEQTGQVHLSDGRVLIAAGLTQAVPPAAKSSPLTRAQLMQALHRALGSVLEAAGFARVPKEHCYRRQSVAATFLVKFDAEAGGLGQQLLVTAELLWPGSERHPLLQHLYPDGAEVLLQLHQLAQDSGLSWPESSGSAGAQTQVQSQAELDRLCAHWRRLFGEAILPLIRRCDSFVGLERELNGNPRVFSPRPLALALAAVVGRADLELVAQALVERLPTWRDNINELLTILRAPTPVDLGPPLDKPVTSSELELQVLPCLKAGRPGLLSAADGQLLPLEHQPVTLPWVADLFSTCVVAQAGQMCHVQYSRLSDMQMTPKELHAQALKNLRQLSRQRLKIVSEGVLRYLQLGDALEASLILLDELWRVELAAETPNGALVAIPEPDRLVFCDVATRGGLSALRALVASSLAAGTLKLTPALFYRRDGKWEALPPRS